MRGDVGKSLLQTVTARRLPRRSDCSPEWRVAAACSGPGMASSFWHEINAKKNQEYAQDQDKGDRVSDRARG